MAALAAGSRSQGNFLYQANINPQADERLTPTQWIEAVDALEKNLGFDGHQRVVVEHVKEGRQHYHIVWNRVDADTLKVADITGNYAKHEKTARDLESRFDLTPTPTPQANRERAPELWEKRAAERSGIDPQQVKADATAAWRQTSTGAAFVAAIESRGYIVAQGDRRDFCLVDHAGTAHSLTRRIEGAKAADVRARMGDIDRTSLPTVAEARASQRQNATIERGSTAPQTAQDPAPEISKGSATNTAAKPPLMVANALTGALTTLAAFADFLCGLTDAPQQPKSRDEIGRENALAQLREQRAAIAALARIRETIERGEHLRSSDVAMLAPSQLSSIQGRGDDALREMIAEMNRRDNRERDFGRVRER